MEETSKIGQKVLPFFINGSKTTSARQARHTGYDATSCYHSETDRLPPTKTLKGTPPPRSVPPIVRPANPMLGT